MSQRAGPRPTFTLPTRVFLYTLDQLAVILGLEMKDLHERYLYYEGVSTGPRGNKMLVRDISPIDITRDWRVAESELKMFMIKRGYRVVEPYLR